MDPAVEGALEKITAPIRWQGPHKRAAKVRAYGLSADLNESYRAAFPREGELLLSGYAEKQKLLHRRPAAVWVRKGKGQVVLMAFSPQFRASTHATYKLLFNGLLLPPPPGILDP